LHSGRLGAGLSSPPPSLQPPLCLPCSSDKFLHGSIPSFRSKFSHYISPQKVLSMFFFRRYYHDAKDINGAAWSRPPLFPIRFDRAYILGELLPWSVPFADALSPSKRPLFARFSLCVGLFHQPPLRVVLSFAGSPPSSIVPRSPFFSHVPPFPDFQNPPALLDHLLSGNCRRNRPAGSGICLPRVGGRV